MKLNFDRKLDFFDYYPSTVLSFYYSPIFSKKEYFMLVNNKDDDMEICVRKKLDNNIDYQLIKVNYSKKEKLILEKKFSEIELKEIQLFQRDIILDGDRFKLEWVNGTRMRLCLEWGGNDLDEWKGVQELTNYLLSLGEIE